MNKNKMVLIGVLCLCFVWSFVFWSISPEVTLKIVWRWLIIGTPDAVSVSLWDVQAGSSVSYTFTDNFWIKDLRWINQGHYTTIQCDWLFQEWWTWAITWVMLKSTVWSLLWWQANQTSINAELQSGDGLDITQPKLYFYRVNSWHNGGVLNTYWDKPTIKISIPEWTPTWTYKWKITYTLYDMPFSM